MFEVLRATALQHGMRVRCGEAPDSVGPKQQPCILRRYTTIKSGRRRLLVPNSAFITREFMVLDDSPADGAHNLWDKPQVGAAVHPKPIGQLCRGCALLHSIVSTAFRRRTSDSVAAARGLVNSSCVYGTLIPSVELDCMPSACLQKSVWQGRGQRQQSHQQQQAQQPGQRAGDAHDWVRQTVLEEQPFHAASSPNFARARCAGSCCIFPSAALLLFWGGSTLLKRQDFVRAGRPLTPLCYRAAHWAADPQAATPTATARTAAARGRRSCSSRTSGGGGGGGMAAAAAGPGHPRTGRWSLSTCASPADTTAPFEGWGGKAATHYRGWTTVSQSGEYTHMDRPFLNT